MSMGPLLEYVSVVDPSIIVTALLGTTLVFVCFSVAAMLAERGSWLFLGGTLMTLLTSMSLMTIFNLFMQSHFLYQVSVKDNVFFVFVFRYTTKNAYLNCYFCFSGTPLPWPDAHVWICTVWHTTYHWETPYGKQGLCATCPGIIHWFYWNVQKTSHHFNTKGMRHNLPYLFHHLSLLLYYWASLFL